MSQHLNSLQIGDTIDVKGPVGHTWYEGRGQFKYKPEGTGKPAEIRQAKHLGLVAGGTGVTPILQVREKGGKGGVFPMDNSR